MCDIAGTHTFHHQTYYLTTLIKQITSLQVESGYGFNSLLRE